MAENKLFEFSAANAELKLPPRKPHSLPVIEGLFRRGTRKRDDAAGSRLLDTGVVMNY
jgi:hypothetical protein